MSQTNFTPISIYYSTTASAVPTAANLVPGELAINTADGKLYYEDSSGVVQTLASKAGALGDVVGPASATDNALARFDLTTGKLIQNSVGILSDAGVLTGLTGLTSSGSITLSSLTSGRVTYAGASGLLTDSTNLLYSGTDLTVYGLTVGRGGGAVATNTVVGASALPSNSGGNTVAIGYQAGFTQTSQGNSTYVGTQAGYFNNGGVIDAFGYRAGYTNSTGTQNVAFGYQSLNLNSTGNGLTALGFNALQKTTASNNTAVGFTALQNNTTGTLNTAVGGGVYGATNGALSANTTGNSNTALGHTSLATNTTGSNNTALGKDTLQANTTASNNTAVGYQSLYRNTAAGNTALGVAAGYQITTGTNNTALGYYTMGSNGGGVTGNQNTAVGDTALTSLSTGSANTAIGYQAAYNTTTAFNTTAVGYQALYNQTTSSATGWNTAFGLGCLSGVTTGYYNIGVGGNAGSNLVTGLSCIYIGTFAAASSTSVQNETVIGSLTGLGANTFYVTGSSGAYNQANSLNWSVVSDARLKKNIVDNNIGLDKITAIQVRNFEYRLEEEIIDLPAHSVIKKAGVQLGVIAQELQQVLPDCVKTESTGVISVNSDNLTWYMINAIKELKAEIDLLKQQLASR